MKYKFEMEFRQDFPETKGETDSYFDLDNYKDWLENKLELEKSKNKINLDNLNPIISNVLKSYTTYPVHEKVVHKAREIFDKYLVLASDKTIEQRERTAKNASLFCVDQVLYDYSQKNIYIMTNETLYDIYRQFWIDVKNYINENY